MDNDFDKDKKTENAGLPEVVRERIRRINPGQVPQANVDTVYSNQSAASKSDDLHPEKEIAEKLNGNDPLQRAAAQLNRLTPGQKAEIAGTIYDELLGRQYSSRAESLAAGKALRKQIARSGQGEWKVKQNRTEGVDIIFDQEKDRIKELLPVRHERMAASSFAFYRAAAAVMAYDLSGLPKTGITVQACGDAHISNFGMFQSPERSLVFDINDFDETLPGSWEWDVKRLLTSVEICGRDRSFSEKERAGAVLSAARTYRESMRDFSEKGNLEVWYEHLDMDRLFRANKKAMGPEMASAIHRAMDKAFSKNNDKAVSKLTEMVNGQLQIISNPPLIVPIREMKEANENADFRWMTRARVEYRLSLPRERRSLIDQYQVIDIARKVVGVGSVGTRDWIVLLEGRETGDYLVLQIKEAGESCFEKYVGKSRFPEHGHRVVAGQRAIQTAGDILLGWSRLPGENGEIEDYYIRQLWDGKGSIDLDSITPDGLTGVADLCAWVLAHAHAKTGDRHMIAGYLGKGDAFERAMLAFAESYADQNEADYAVFLRRV